MAVIRETADGKIEVVSGEYAIRVRTEHRVYAEHDLTRPAIFKAFVDSVQFPDGILDCSSPMVHRYRDGLEFEISSLPEEMCAISDYFQGFEPTPQSVVFDIGAYCGVTTYHFAKLCRLVVAVEPDPLSFGCLYRNAVAHKLNNVVLMCGAVSGGNGWKQFNAEGALGSSLRSSHTDRVLLGSTTVATRTLESLVDEYGEPDLVKLDVEGAELGILNASRDLLKRFKNTRFVLDTCHTDGWFPTASRAEQIFRDCGYETRSSDSDFICTWAWRN